MEDKEQKKNRYTKAISTWLPNLYYVGTLISLAFIMAQVFYAKRSVVESSEWEKAKMTIENVAQFKVELSKLPISGTDKWTFADQLWPDFSTPKGWSSSHADTLLSVYTSLFDDETEIKEGVELMIDVMNAFAYPIIMGYASEMGSYQSVARQFCSYGNYIMPTAFRHYVNIGHHAKLLHRLWRIRYEQMVVDITLAHSDERFSEYWEKHKDRMLFFEEAEISKASLKKYKKKLERKLKEMQKEIEDFRKNSLN